MYITSTHIKIFKLYNVVEDFKILSEILKIPQNRVYSYYQDIKGQILSTLIENQYISKEERIAFIVLSLLKKHQINLTEISEKFSITRRSLNNDILEIKEFFHKKDIELLSLNSKGVVISGKDEKVKYLFFTTLYKTLLSINEFPVELIRLYCELFPELENSELTKEIKESLEVADMEVNFYNKQAFLALVTVFKGDLQLEEKENPLIINKLNSNNYFKIDSKYLYFLFGIINQNSPEHLWKHRNLKDIEVLTSFLKEKFSFEIDDSILKTIYPFIFFSRFKENIELIDLNFFGVLEHNTLMKEEIEFWKSLKIYFPYLGFYEVSRILRHLHLISRNKENKGDCLVYNLTPLAILKEHIPKLEKKYSLKIKKIVHIDELDSEIKKQEVFYPVTSEKFLKNSSVGSVKYLSLFED